MCLSHFPRFPVFKPSSRSCRVCVSSSTFFCFLSKFQVLEYAFFIFKDFHCFSPYSRSHTEHFSFSIFFTVFLLHISLYSVCVSFSTFFRVFFLFFCDFHFTFYTFSRFSFFLPYSRSYSVHFSFSTFLSGFFFFAIFQVLECPFLIIRDFSVFLDKFQITQCLCLIFHVFQFSWHIPGPTVCVFHFLRF